jgi:hypothetical protein
MSPALLALSTGHHYFVRDPACVQELKMSGEHLIDRILGDQTDWRDFNHGTPGFAPLILR